jgi:hypothetical protein
MSAVSLRNELQEMTFLTLNIITDRQYPNNHRNPDTAVGTSILCIDKSYINKGISVFFCLFSPALLGTKYITLITYKYNKHAVPKRENSERAIIAHARLPPETLCK